jgi:hypothetical protein
LFHSSGYTVLADLKTLVIQFVSNLRAAIAALMFRVNCLYMGIKSFVLNLRALAGLLRHLCNHYETPKKPGTSPQHAIARGARL